MFSPDELLHPGHCIMVTDELPSPADFILHRLLAHHLKQSGADTRCILVTTSQDISRWKHIGAKSASEVLYLCPR
jgi:hypothetical protein